MKNSKPTMADLQQMTADDLYNFHCDDSPAYMIIGGQLRLIEYMSYCMESNTYIGGAFDVALEGEDYDRRVELYADVYLDTRSLPAASDLEGGG